MQSTDKQVDVTGFQQSRLQATFRKFYDRYNDLICPYKAKKKCVFTVTQPSLFFHPDLKTFGKFMISWKFCLPLEANGISSITAESVFKTVDEYKNITNINS
jgi:hypothetical protein